MVYSSLGRERAAETIFAYIFVLCCLINVAAEVCSMVSHADDLLQDEERIAVYIRGAQCINRAVDGDIVAFELLPEVEWYSQDGMPDESAKEVKGIAQFFHKRSVSEKPRLRVQGSPRPRFSQHPNKLVNWLR